MAHGLWKMLQFLHTCIKDRTILATASGWSLARRSRVARKFLHLILAVSGVICCPMVLLNIIRKVIKQTLKIILLFTQNLSRSYQKYGFDIRDPENPIPDP